MIVVAVIVGMIVMGIRRMGIGAVRVVVMLDRVAARVARMRAEDRRSAPRENRADQRQKDDCLDHFRICVNPSSD